MTRYYVNNSIYASYSILLIKCCGNKVGPEPILRRVKGGRSKLWVFPILQTGHAMTKGTEVRKGKLTLHYIPK